MGPISSKQYNEVSGSEKDDQSTKGSYVLNPSEMEYDGLEMSEKPLPAKPMAESQVTALCDLCLRNGFTQRTGTSVCVQCDLYLCEKCTDTHEFQERHLCHKSENEEEVINSFLTSFFNETHRRDTIKSVRVSICDEISVEHELDRKACFVMGMCGIGKNNMLAVVDWRNTCVKIVNLRTRLLDRYIQFNSTPCGVALIDIKADETYQDPNVRLDAGTASGFNALAGTTSQTGCYTQSGFTNESGVNLKTGSSFKVDPHAQSDSNTQYSCSQQSDPTPHSVCTQQSGSTGPSGFDKKPRPSNQSGFTPQSSSTIQSNSYNQPCSSTDSGLSQQPDSTVPHESHSDVVTHKDGVPSEDSNMTSHQRAAPSGARVLAVTFPDRQQIVYIDCGTTPASRVKTIQMGTRPYRLEYFEGRLYVLCFDSHHSSPVFLINVMTVEGKTLATLDTEIRVGKKYHHNSSIYFSQPDLCVLPGRIFVNNPFKNEVKCMDFNGALVATQLVGNVNIGGIAADSGNGNLYTRKDYKLYRLSSDLKHYKVVLDSTVFECYSGSLCHYNDKLFVAHADNLLAKNSILVIRLV